ncbi:MAG TPA: hypothetical protein VGO90_03675 [Chthoniobacteraceae bacterium]|nr:hypothetical protein [Chthoniobacteraceae bacterium]
MSEIPQPTPPEGTPNTHAHGLGPATSSDVRALHDDLEQARQLAQRSQRELLGKSSELEALKELFEKARKHLIQLQMNITQLRDERHQLANQATEAEALKQKLIVVTADRDRLRAQLEGIRKWQG